MEKHKNIPGYRKLDNDEVDALFTKLYNTARQNIEGQKFDQEKTRWDLLPWDSAEAVAEVLTYGAKKYAPNNWQIVPDGVDRYFAACLRHLVAWRKGEKVDKESGLRHLAHAACCLMFLLHLDK